MNNAFDNFERCADESPDRTYVDAKYVRELIGDATDKLIRDVRQLGLKADNCDLARKVEVALYDYIKESNPDSCMFAIAEGCGAALNGPSRDRVLATMVSNQQFFANMAAAQYKAY